MLRRGVIYSDATLCVGGYGSLETFSHLFLHYRIFWEVWHFIHHWFGVCSVLPNVLMDYFNQFSFVGGNCSKVRQSIMHLIWYATMWENGKKEITGCSLVKNVRHLRSLIRLSHLLLCG